MLEGPTSDYFGYLKVLYILEVAFLTAQSK